MCTKVTSVSARKKPMVPVEQLVPRPHPAFRHFRYNSVLKATESWAGPGNESRFLLGTGQMPHLVGGAMGVTLCTTYEGGYIWFDIILLIIHKTTVWVDFA